MDASLPRGHTSRIIIELSLPRPTGDVNVEELAIVLLCGVIHDVQGCIDARLDREIRMLASHISLQPLENSV